MTSVEEDINDDDDDDGTDRLMDGSVFATRSVAVVRPLARSRKTPTENMLHTQTCDNNRNCGVA